ncbi:MAG: hypothetical protein HY984_00625 [Candidatus Magasanikbacteria bacterium]|nr:hypothetical protein [Candidatus Magasanikbacteria bacterium]
MVKILQTYKYTFSLLFSILVAIVLFRTGTLDYLTHALRGYAYLSATVAGFLFAISVTAPTAGLYFVALGQGLNSYAVVLFGATGAMAADIIMYRFIKDGLLEEFKLIIEAVLAPHHRERMEAITEHRVFVWIVPFVASALIASPLPDEIGLALFSLINFHPKYLSIIAFVLNAAGIATLVFIGHSLAT